MRQPQIKRSPSRTKKYTYPFYIKCVKFSLAFIYFYKDTKRGKIDFKINQIMQNLIQMHDARFV